MERLLTELDFLSSCGSTQFARRMSTATPFIDLSAAARDIWLHTVDVNGYLKAFSVHPQIGSNSISIPQLSTEEQSAAAATATDSTLWELIKWNARYKEKFGFVFLICASERGSPEILAELQRCFSNKPIVELAIASQEQLKILKLRLTRLFGGGAVVHCPVSSEHHLCLTNITGGSLELDSDGFVVLMPGTAHTSVKGVIAAGDVQDERYRNVISAAGSGCMGALDGSTTCRRLDVWMIRVIFLLGVLEAS